MKDKVSPWREVEDLPDFNGGVSSVLASVDTLRAAWERSIREATPEEFHAARDRSLRRHAIETGIIERLYDVEWGVTEALVAEGLTLDVAAREGGITDGALETIRAQFDALKLMAELARTDRPLTAHVIRELHHAITREQATYEARDQFGRIVQAPLHHGAWKSQPNHVRRPDGTLLEYTPPERVQDQIEALTERLAGMSDSHPIEVAAWLHHRFICIHPFEDGNGRVARALTLLILMRANYAPLVVDRNTRANYLRSLDAANDGDFAPLVRLFGGLEIVTLRSELERPTEAQVDRAGGAVEIADAYVHRLLRLQETTDKQRRSDSGRLAGDLHERIRELLLATGAQLVESFKPLDPASRFSIDHAAPPDSRASFWRAQIIRAAREVDFFTNLSEGTWWTRLHLTVLRSTLRYGVVVQKVGHAETGVLAITMFAETLATTDDDGERAHSAALRLTTEDSMTLVHSDSASDRWGEVEESIGRTLAEAVNNYARNLG